MRQVAAAKGKRITAPLPAPLAIDKEIADPAAWKEYAQDLKGGDLVVSVPARGQKGEGQGRGQGEGRGRGQPQVSEETGPGGTVLLILARKENRRISPDITVSALRPETLRPLMEAGLCDDGLCDAVSKNTSPSARDLIKNDLATDIEDSGGGGPRILWFLVAFGVGLALLGWLLLMVRRGSGRARRPAFATEPSERLQPRPMYHGVHPEPAGHAGPAGPAQWESRRIPMPRGPKRTATVRTALHPQGYVELDRCLYRAVWADLVAPPPTLGDDVDVVEGTGKDADILFAFARPSRTRPGPGAGPGSRPGSGPGSGPGRRVDH
ncbi:hypothetical protein [Actinomadura rudentiformis]|uniref:Uncharacterized protein n=1 Tax=Actinomadura rudentiformis TaxID=359158 RepID=A0A6H9YKM5_9ACTN|nr:hypothetical protein [Actinomadura rudentiformis]KAB2339758.1 hypothetical protein F8566_46625 [Actinomadura rudentiformis]